MEIIPRKNGINMSSTARTTSSLVVHLPPIKDSSLLLRHPSATGLYPRMVIDIHPFRQTSDVDDGGCRQRTLEAVGVERQQCWLLSTKATALLTPFGSSSTALILET